MAVVKVESAIVSLPSFSALTDLVDKAELEFYRTGNPLTVFATPEDIVRVVRLARKEGWYPLAGERGPNNAPSVRFGSLLIISCMTEC